MLKWTRRILVFTLLGAIINVAVAWGCVVRARWYPVQATWRDPTPGECAWWNRNAPAGFADRPEFAITQCEGIGVNGVLMARVSSVGFPLRQKLCWIRSGLPLRSMGCDRWQLAPDEFSRDKSLEPRDGIRWAWRIEGQYSDGSPSTHLLPIRPDLPAFALNTGMFAVLLGCLCVVPAASRRWRRVRMNRCASCGYPRGASLVCTECGEALPEARDSRIDSIG